MKTLFAAAVLNAALAAAPAAKNEKTAPIHLQALVPTGGTDAAALLDGDPKTGWSPVGDARDEGVLFRFEDRVAVDRVVIEACAGSDPKAFVLGTYVNGREAGSPAAPMKVEVARGQLRSLFLRVANATAKPCIAEVRFEKGKARLPVAAPRTVPGRVSASSTLTPIDAYHPGYLFDQRLDFGWVEGAKGLGVGESVTLELEAPVSFSAIEIWNGYQRSKDHFRKNARAAEVSVRVDEGEPVRFAVKDVMGPQKLSFAQPVTGKRVVVKIEKAKAGTKYQDLVLSELRPWDAQGPLAVATPDRAERAAALSREIAGKPLAKVVDRQFVVFCPDEDKERSGRLKLRSDHTLVWYGDSEDWDGARESEVLDGTWVVKRQAAPWSTIDLFARRHRTQQVNIPYGTPQKREAERIAGGSLKIARVEDLGMVRFGEIAKAWREGPARTAVGCITEAGLDADYAALVKRGAILVEGRALTELLVLP